MPPKEAGFSLYYGSAASLAGQGILLRGPSGSGKSDLLLRLLDSGAELIADDQVRISVREGRPWMMAPEALHGWLEMRGYGILSVPHVTEAPLALVVELDSDEYTGKSSGERLPEERYTDIAGIAIPCMALHAASASAVARIRAALVYKRLDAA